MSDEATAHTIELLDAESIPYILVGSYASNVYGASRKPLDADFVIKLDGISIDEQEQRLSPISRYKPGSFQGLVRVC